MADDTRYDRTRLGPDWTWDDEPYYYAAQVSALTVAPDTDYDAGTVIVQAAPGASAGDRPVLTTTPATGYLRFDNRAETVASGETSISFEREHGSNTVVVTGQIVVGDEPGECVHRPSERAVLCEWVWQTCCTDGVLVGPLRDGECVTVTLDGARGVSAPVVLDGSDRPIERVYGEPMEICAQIRPAV